MKVKITRNTVAAKKAVFIGEVHDLSEYEARYLVQSGKAEEYKPKPKAKKKPASLTTKTAAAIVKKARKK